MLHEKLDMNKKYLEYLPYGNESDNNSLNPSNSTKKRKDKKQKLREWISHKGRRHKNAIPRIEKEATEESLWLFQVSDLQPTKYHKRGPGNIPHTHYNDEQEL